MTVQEAIDWLKVASAPFHNKDKRTEAINTAIKCMNELEQYRALGTVEELKEAREKQPKTDWIPCEERLPELDEGMECFKQSKEYLVTVQWWDEETNVDIGWYNQNGMWSNDSKNCKVIAWQPRPLPQPYKKEGAE